MQGELSFSDTEPTTKSSKAPWTVSRLNREVRSCLESRLGTVWVEGEVSNLRRQPSGHQYFSLKDANSQVSCVMFRSAAASAPALRDSLQVEIFGDLSVYEQRGQYQIIVRRVQPRGAGELEARLRALQEKLRAEGLFDPARKKPLPPFPTRLGVVTSPAGAAIRDFLHILRRRAPQIEVFLAPVRVQGRGAAAEIAAAVQSFAHPDQSGFPAVDVIIVTRGGGSLEDLWEFNEESVARAIAASPVPVISAVGHEIDTTTADFAADLRAPTPSAAAELVCADRAETLVRLGAALRRLARATGSRLELARAQFEQRTASGVFQRPLRRIADLRQVTDDLRERGALCVRAHLSLLRESCRRAETVLQARSPAARLGLMRERFNSLTARQSSALAAGLRQRRQQHERHVRALDLLGPRQTLARGFTLTLDRDRRPLTAAAEASQQEEMVTVFADGEVISRPGKP
jgi:exodeoxyribonuclease VII large subunit